MVLRRRLAAVERPPARRRIKLVRRIDPELDPARRELRQLREADADRELAEVILVAALVGTLDRSTLAAADARLTVEVKVADAGRDRGIHRRRGDDKVVVAVLGVYKTGIVRVFQRPVCHVAVKDAVRHRAAVLPDAAVADT